MNQNTTKFNGLQKPIRCGWNFLLFYILHILMYMYSNADTLEIYIVFYRNE